MKTNDEPAFPTYHNVNDPRADGFISAPGLTKREWFAGMALQGMIAGSQGLQITVAQFAEQSFRLADAMIEEGKK